jgi:hypothetical protein
LAWHLPTLLSDIRMGERQTLCHPGNNCFESDAQPKRSYRRIAADGTYGKRHWIKGLVQQLPEILLEFGGVGVALGGRLGQQFPNHRVYGACVFDPVLAQGGGRMMNDCLQL